MTPMVPSSSQAPLFDSQSLPLVEEMYARYVADPYSVDSTWRAYFLGLAASGVAVGNAPAAGAEGDDAATRLARAWRERGHLCAAINPLFPAPHLLPELKAETYGLSAQDVTPWQAIYGGSMGVETRCIREPEERQWVQDWFESGNGQQQPDAETRRALFVGLVQAGALESFLHKKFAGAKRFSVEGNDGIIPLLRHVVEAHAAAGGTRMVLGMAHRGRLNVLVNLLHKSTTELFAAFADKLTTTGAPLSGDVKYHMGKTYVHHAHNGKDVTLQLLFNPSHLEAVNPAVLGVARGYQDLGEVVLPILIHGDSAVSGQGVVAETNNLMSLKPYTVGGTLHVVLNNQVGFTGNPEDMTSGAYCTDMFAPLGIPVVHVNADDIEACRNAFRFALDYRNTFHKDVALDLVGYRRWGHNEGDDPTFTQPTLYDKIHAHPTPAEVYKAKLLTLGFDKTVLDIIESTTQDDLNKAFAEAQNGVTSVHPAPAETPAEPQTAVTAEAVNNVQKAYANLPKGFEMNPKIERVVEERIEMLKGEKPLNWGAAEVTAYGTLLQQGISVRLTGQDVQRGTFSHRDAVLVSGADDAKWNVLQSLSAKGAQCAIETSALSENAIMGFEYGYALARTDTLVIWEAQFGDFANGAQVVIDQFMAAAEAKWGQLNGLTLLLPHGFEGQGPEHSSARLERFLQLCAQNNMTVAVPSTPAQIFHLLRRQAQSALKRPLVVMTPKSLLRNQAATSPMGALLGGTFNKVIPDAGNAANVKRVVLCSGKFYYDLLARKEAEKRDDVALVRVEQLYPWPEAELAETLTLYKANVVVWAQEEPRNMGAWNHVRDHWNPDWGYLRLASRPASASPAVGSLSRHTEEQKALVYDVFGETFSMLPKRKNRRLGEPE